METSDIVLPAPILEGKTSLEACLERRRSVRSYADTPLTLAEISQLLWAAQGETHPRGLRTAPSAGARYPLEVYLVAGRVDGLPPGVYRYLSHGHRLVPVREGDRRRALSRGALEQYFIGEAPATVVLAAVFERITRKYGERGILYTYMEAGHAAQNLHLQAVGLGLGSVPVGAFREEEIKAVIGGPADERPIYIVPVGRGTCRNGSAG